MRPIFLLLMVLVSLSGCQPAAKQPDTALMLLHDADLTLVLTPANAPVETPLQLQLTAPQLLAVHAELTGVSMYMGRIPLRFTQHGAGWQADFLLGACAERKMLWQLQLELEFADGKKRTVKQRFHSSWR